MSTPAMYERKLAEIKALEVRLADAERLREDERLTWDAQHKRQASMNAHLAALVTDAQEELRKCQQDAIQLQARLAEAEALLLQAEGQLYTLLHVDLHGIPPGSLLMKIRAHFASDSADEVIVPTPDDVVLAWIAQNTFDQLGDVDLHECAADFAAESGREESVTNHDYAQALRLAVQIQMKAETVSEVPK